MAAYVSTGVVVTFGSMTGELLDISASGSERPSVDVTHQVRFGTEETAIVTRDFLQGIIDGGTIELTINFDPDSTDASQDGAETLIIALPVTTGLTNRFASAPAICTRKGGFDGPLGEKFTGTVELQLKEELHWDSTTTTTTTSA